MRTNNARKLDRKNQEALKIRGVKMVLSGESPSKVIKLLRLIQTQCLIGWQNIKRRQLSNKESVTSDLRMYKFMESTGVVLKLFYLPRIHLI